jgi:hypothetical protein
MLSNISGIWIINRIKAAKSVPELERSFIPWASKGSGDIDAYM